MASPVFRGVMGRGLHSSGLLTASFSPVAAHGTFVRKTVNKWTFSLLSQPWSPSAVSSTHFSTGVVVRDLRNPDSLKSPKKPISEEEEKKIRRKKLLIGGILGGALVGSIFAYKSLNKNNKLHQISNDGMTKDYLLEEAPPYFKPAREIRPENDQSGLKITLFQYQTCPFCCKARAFLDYYGFNYDVIEVNSVLRKQVKWSKYKKVPIVVVQYRDKIIQINDSSVIVSALYSHLVNNNSDLDKIMDCYPVLRFYDPDGKEKSEIENKYFLMYNEFEPNRAKKEIVSERKWRRWTDEVLVHTLSPNVYRTPGESLEAFRWFNEVGNWDEHFEAWERYLVVYVGALAMFLISKRLKKRHNLKDNVRESLYDECNKWMAAIKEKGTPFMGGVNPNLADLAVFGVLNAIEGCQAFQDARENTTIGIWFDLMKETVANRNGQADLLG